MGWGAGQSPSCPDGQCLALSPFTYTEVILQLRMRSVAPIGRGPVVI